MRELDRDMCGKPTVSDGAQEIEVLIAHRVGGGARRHLLAELREYGADAACREFSGRGERRAGIFARHEAAHGSAREAPPPELIGEPAAPRGPEQNGPGDRHVANISIVRSPRV